MSSEGAGRWTLPEQEGFDSLRYDPGAVGGRAEDLAPDEVLVELHAASLNYRDLVITKSNAGTPMAMEIIPSVVPGSDGAGKVLAVGSAAASRFRPGQDVVTHLAPGVADDGALPVFADITAGLGQQVHGTLQRRGVFPTSGLVALPEGPDPAMSYAQAATLTCSGITAWNALMGLRGREVKRGDWIVTQGTGGVSVAALQFAVAVGANVIATTSSDTKASKLRALGAAHVLNYRTEPEWGAKAKMLTPGGQGVDHVVDVAGGRTLSESLKAVRTDGLITLAGAVGGFDAQGPPMMAGLWHQCVVRGVLLGTRDMLADMVRFVQENKIDLALDDAEFKLEDAKAAYERLEKQQHFAKVVIKMA